MAWNYNKPQTDVSMQELGMSVIKEFTKGDFMKLAMTKCIEAGGDVTKFDYSVKILDSMVIDQFDDIYNIDKYLIDVNNKKQELMKKTKDEEIIRGEMALFKFAHLSHFVFKDTPLIMSGSVISPKRTEEERLKKEAKENENNRQ